MLCLGFTRTIWYAIIGNDCFAMIRSLEEVVTQYIGQLVLTVVQLTALAMSQSDYNTRFKLGFNEG